jgi:hypothetical protein
VVKYLTWLLLVAIAFGCALHTPPVGGPVRENAHWRAKRFPIRIKALNTLGPCRVAKLTEAADRWNQELARAGAPVKAFILQTVENLNRPRVGHLWVVPGVLSAFTEPRTLGSCKLGYYEGSAEIWTAVVTLSNKHCLFRTSAHELGHALGLRHAPRSCLGCIMRAEVPYHEGRLVDFGWLRRSELLYVIRQMGFSHRR